LNVFSNFKSCYVTEIKNGQKEKLPFCFETWPSTSKLTAHKRKALLIRDHNNAIFSMQFNQA